MKPNELKQGMVCEMRNKLSFTIVDNDKAFRPDMYFCLSGNYENNLTHKRDKQHDIMKVFYGDKVVWERKESTFWLPENGEKYYFLSHRKVTEAYINENDDWDRELFKATLVFRTEEEAEKQLLKQQATIRVIKEIARLNAGWLPNWNDGNESKYFIHFSYENDILNYSTCFKHKHLDNNLYLKSEELAKKLIATHEQDLKRMLEVE